MASKSQTLRLIRNLLVELKHHEELKKSTAEHLCWRKSPIYNEIRNPSTFSDLANVENIKIYTTVLHGSRRAQELIVQYRGVGERSVEETARMVGLKLPKKYEDKNET
eukprot:TCONS_00061924-protein